MTTLEPPMTTDVSMLQTWAVDNGLKIDKRWGVERLRTEILKQVDTTDPNADREPTGAALPEIQHTDTGQPIRHIPSSGVQSAFSSVKPSDMGKSDPPGGGAAVQTRPPTTSVAPPPPPPAAIGTPSQIAEAKGKYEHIMKQLDIHPQIGGCAKTIRQYVKLLGG